MKYKTFRALALVAGASAVGGLFVFGSSWCQKQEAIEEAREEKERAREDARRAAAIEREERDGSLYRDIEKRSAMGGPARGGSAHETRLRTMLGQPSAGEEKRKDLFGGGPVKVNVYAEDGVWIRAKVDLDRDDRWDEKWRIDGGTILRQVAIADDEHYGDEAPLDVPAPPVASDDPVGGGESGGAGGPSELRQVDELMLSLLSRPVVKKIKDASKGRPFKINLYSDGGSRFERAKVDLDRDDRWDEKWAFGADRAVSRQVSPADDETYSESFALEAGVRWVATP
jgi:hypothetical protein